MYLAGTYKDRSQQKGLACILCAGVFFEHNVSQFRSSVAPLFHHSTFFNTPAKYYSFTVPSSRRYQHSGAGSCLPCSFCTFLFLPVLAGTCETDKQRDFQLHCHHHVESRVGEASIIQTLVNKIPNTLRNYLWLNVTCMLWSHELTLKITLWLECTALSNKDGYQTTICI